MKSIALLALVLLCTGCTRFEHPIVAEGGPALDPALIGRWEMQTPKGRYEFEIQREGEAGRVKPLVMEPEPEEMEKGDFRLVTARIGAWDFASLELLSEPDDGWAPVRYQLLGERLIVINSSGEFWRTAVENQVLPGVIDKSGTVTSTTVTASGVELRKFLEGHAPVGFPEVADPEMVFTRVR